MLGRVLSDNSKTEMSLLYKTKLEGSNLLGFCDESFSLSVIGSNLSIGRFDVYYSFHLSTLLLASIDHCAWTIYKLTAHTKLRLHKQELGDKFSQYSWDDQYLKLRDIM